MSIDDLAKGLTESIERGLVDDWMDDAGREAVMQSMAEVLHAYIDPITSAASALRADNAKLREALERIATSGWNALDPSYAATIARAALAPREPEEICEDGPDLDDDFDTLGCPATPEPKDDHRANGKTLTRAARDEYLASRPATPEPRTDYERGYANGKADALGHARRLGPEDRPATPEPKEEP